MTRNFYALIFSAVMILSAIFISGCGSDTEILPPQMPDSVNPAPKPDPNFDKIESDVYFDATVSMQGYTTLDGGNVYRNLPDSLNDICGRMGGVSFYSFGEKIQPLNGRDYRRFNSPAPYTEIITAVHNVIDNANSEHLSIIVTDLFENDADWSNIAQKIREKYFTNNLAAAVIGIKNSFNGDIFDIDFNAAKIPYNSNLAEERFRPFYLLVLGQEPAVKVFIQKFSEKQSLPNETKYLLLSKKLASTMSEFPEDPALLKLENFFAEEKLKLDENPAYNGVDEFALDNFDEPAAFESYFYYKPAFDALPLDMSKMNFSAKIFYADNGEWIERNKNDARITLTPAGETQNSYTIRLELTPEKSLNKGTLNFVQILIAPADKAYKLPAWIDTWNMSEVDVNPVNFDGAKTVNLAKTLDSLKDSAITAPIPPLVNLKFIVDVP